MVSGADGPVELDDVQGNVLAGYGFDHAHYAFVEVTAGASAAAREWLRPLAERTTPATDWGPGTDAKPAATLNLAFSFAGLRRLAVPEAILARFPGEFKEGMRGRAERLLGDTGPSAPEHWEPGLGDGRGHVLVTICARSGRVLEERWSQLRGEIEARARDLTLVSHLRAAALPSAREHFGFADGFSQPDIDDPVAGPARRPGNGTPTRHGWAPLKAGEFVLGYRDESGDAAPDPFGERNSSYMVVRKLHQHVARFARSMLGAAGGDPVLADRLAAKVVGRWQGGASLAAWPAPPDRAPTREELTDFRYRADAEGFGCPLGAHVRRANPRDALGFDGKLARRHRIIRRGMSYGEPPQDRLADDDEPRGLMFVAYQASIARQFEFVQSQWLGDGDAFGLGDDPDPLLGSRGKLVVQGRPPRLLAPSRAVETRGGEYMFVPGIRLLRRLAS